MSSFAERHVLFCCVRSFLAKAFYLFFIWVKPLKGFRQLKRNVNYDV
jgi:hypothetical protein